MRRESYAFLTYLTYLVSLSSYLIEISITHEVHAVASRDGHIGQDDLADCTNK